MRFVGYVPMDKGRRCNIFSLLKKERTVRSLLVQFRRHRAGRDGSSCVLFLPGKKVEYLLIVETKTSPTLNSHSITTVCLFLR